MTVCTYAACTRTATTTADGWEFCSLHLLHHRAITSDAPLPATAPTFPQFALRRGCGTRAAYRRHLRRGEDACDACLDAETRGRKGYTASRKQWHGVAS